MAPNGSQALDLVDIEDLIVKLSPKISEAVRRVYCHPTNKCEIEDITQDVLLKLIEDDYRRLRSFKGSSKIETWLHKVVEHCVGQYLWKRRREKGNVSLNGLSPDALSYLPTQEKSFIDEAERKALYAHISRLTEHKRRLFRLALQGLKSEDIEKEIGIKVDSVYSEKSALFREVRESV